VLGGGGARGAAQVGVLLGLFGSGLGPPGRLVGSSVGALNASLIAAHPSLAGAQMLRQVWLSRVAREVFRIHPVSSLLAGMRRQLSTLPSRNVLQLIEATERLTGISTFEQLRLPLQVVATDVEAGIPEVFSSGPLTLALLASTAIPGVFPAVSIGDRDFLDGGIVDNTPIGVAVSDGARQVLAIHLMAGGELHAPPRTWSELITRTLQLSLHHRMLADFERLKSAARVVVLAPVLPLRTSWQMDAKHVTDVIERAEAATRKLLGGAGSALWRRSAVHYLDLGL
jgi:NTE family protein